MKDGKRGGDEPLVEHGSDTPNEQFPSTRESRLCGRLHKAPARAAEGEEALTDSWLGGGAVHPFWKYLGARVAGVSQGAPGPDGHGDEGRMAAVMAQGSACRTPCHGGVVMAASAQNDVSRLCSMLQSMSSASARQV